MIKTFWKYSSYTFNKVAYKLLRRYHIYAKMTDNSDNTIVLHIHES